MLSYGQSPDMADYDGRTALELACVKGHVEVGPTRPLLPGMPAAESCELARGGVLSGPYSA